MRIPILNIQDFEQEEPLKNFYSNSFLKHINANRNFFHKPHSHDFYLCVIFTHGSGKHEIDFNTYPIQPGSIFFLKPGQSHFWNFDTVPKGYIFFHTQDFYEFYFFDQKLNSFPFWFSYQNPPVLVIPEIKIKKTITKFEEINWEYHNEELFKKTKILNLLNSIYIDLAREYTETNYDPDISSPTYHKTLSALENLIDKHFYREKSASFYANKLNISTKHLNRITKETINKTTSQLISERVILEAKRLIVHTDNSLAQTGEILQFSDYAYFSKVFKSKTGITPISFKRKYC